MVVTAMLCGCVTTPPMKPFTGSTPTFDPVIFYSGHTRSWGVREDRSGVPVGIVTTDCLGKPEGPDGLHMVQRITKDDGTVQVRDWHMRRIGDHRYEGTANDMVGTATGESEGRTFHWTWTLATKPGYPVWNVTMEQWMYLMDDGAMVDRTVVNKFGVVIAELTEQFEHVP